LLIQKLLLREKKNHTVKEIEIIKSKYNKILTDHKKIDTGQLEKIQVVSEIIDDYINNGINK